MVLEQGDNVVGIINTFKGNDFPVCTDSNKFNEKRRCGAEIICFVV